MSKKNTTIDLMFLGAPERAAITAPGRKPLNYGNLKAFVYKLMTQLCQFGVQKTDRVAIILPNGPEMATSFIAVSGVAVAAPLNPNYSLDEFKYYLNDLNAKAIIIQHNECSAALTAAQELDLKIFILYPQTNQEAGVFSLEGPKLLSKKIHNILLNDDIALVLHTSGTTSRPKIVPLSHQNITTSAQNIGSWLKLTPQDKCLNIMPLFHIHGLIASLLTSLITGGCVSCTNGFNALRFFSWLNDESPTWYSAVPTMHQSILSRASRNSKILDLHCLKFIRSSSASLPVSVMQTLEEVFGIPVIEAYGMTEASHQMTSNPLPPGKRIPGSVGLKAGPDIGIMDEEGNLLPNGNQGEVVIKGENVTLGYENNKDANASSFENGWFRSGDQGIIDKQGYLTLTGRLKEVINRGGEKISPHEVDAILMEHKAVQQAVTFSIPHDKLGEEIAAAIVLHDNVTTSEKQLKIFAEAKLSRFKVPKKILFLSEIPKGPTGKLQRVGLAKKLGLT